MALPYALAFILLFCFPIAYLILQSLRSITGSFTAGNYTSLIGSATSLASVRNTALVALLVTAGCLVLGFAVARVVQLAPGLIKGIILGLVIAPFFVTVTARVFGWLAIMSSHGPTVGLWMKLTGQAPSPKTMGLPVVCMALIQIFLPFAVLPILSSLVKADPLIDRSARSLGAGPWRRLLKVTLPLATPGVLTAAVLVFGQTISSFFVPDILGGGFVILLPNVVVNDISFFYNPQEAAAAAVMLAAGSLAVIGLLTALVRSRAGIYRAEAARAAAPFREGPEETLDTIKPNTGLAARLNIRPVRALQYASPSRHSARAVSLTALLLVVVVIGLAIIVIPLLMTVALAFSAGPVLSLPIPAFTLARYQQVLQYHGYVDALMRSILLALAVVLGAGSLGALTAIAAHYSRGRFAVLLQLIILSPIVLPSLAFGLALFEWFAVFHLHAGLLPLFLGHVVLATPFVTRTVLAGLEHLDPDLEKAARTLGARQVYALRRVTLPLITPALLSASIFAFWISFDNFTVSYFFDSPDTRTVPIQLLVMTGTVVDPRLAAGATLLLLVSLPLFVVLRSLLSIQTIRDLW